MVFKEVMTCSLDEYASMFLSSNMECLPLSAIGILYVAHHDKL